MVAMLAVPLLGEHIGPRRWAAIGIGFFGVLIVVRPGLGLVHWAASLSLLCALFGACYQISTRKLAGVDRAVTTQFYSALVGARSEAHTSELQSLLRTSYAVFCL